MTVRRAPKVRFLDAARAQRSSNLQLIDVRRVASVALDAAVPDGDEPKWQHVATEGTFKGYGGGLEPFKFDAGVFNTIVKNFRAHPAFSMGPDGVGTNGIVQWDFHHAAEAPPGDVAVAGAPAQGWVRDLRVQVGPKGAELWALTEWLEPLKSYVKEKKYKWSSVAVALDAVDPVSGAHIGPVLTSIAATNLPFIEGMNELAATKQGEPKTDPPKKEPEMPAKQKVQAEQIMLGAKVVAAYRAYNVDEAKDCIRTCLGLPVTATAGDIVSSINVLAGLMKAGSEVQDATGIDAGKTIGDLRTILGLPLLTMPDSVVEQALSLFDTEAIGDAGASTEKAPGDGESVPGATTTAAKPSKALDQHGSPVGGLPQSAKEKTMTLQLSQLAKRLEVRETDEAVASAIDSMLDVRSTLIESLQLDRNVSDAKLANAVKGIAKEADRRRKLANAFTLLVACMAGASVTKKGELRLESVSLEGDDGEDDEEASGGDPMKHPLIQKLKGLMTAGGVEDPDKAAAQIVKTLTDAAALEALEPEFKKLKSYKASTEAEAEASAVAATLRNYFSDDEAHKDMVVAFYKSAGREKFLERYPSIGEDAPANHAPIALEQNTGARRASQQVEPTEPAAPKTSKVALARKGQKAPEGDVVDISMYPGANDSERSINALKATVEGAEKWDYDTLCATAFNARREGRFVNLSKH